jgi:hypothetical protein
MLGRDRFDSGAFAHGSFRYCGFAPGQIRGVARAVEETSVTAGRSYLQSSAEHFQQSTESPALRNSSLRPSTGFLELQGLRVPTHKRISRPFDRASVAGA